MRVTYLLAGVPTAGRAGIEAAWSAPAEVVLPLILLAGAYARGVTVLRRRAGAVAVAGRRARTFAAGLGVVALCLLSPLEALASQLLTAHMVQHLLLVTVAPVLIVMSRPSVPLLAAAAAVLGPDRRRRLHRMAPVRRLRRSALRSAPGHPLAVALIWVVHIATQLAWHAPVAYDAALRSELLHAAEHATLLATAVAAWGTASRPASWSTARAGSAQSAALRRRGGAAVGGVVATAVVGGLLAALLTFSREPWYGRYTVSAPSWGVTALADQQVAGALMWVIGGALYLAASVVMFARWLAAFERPNVVGARHAPQGPEAEVLAGDHPHQRDRGPLLRDGASCWVIVAVLTLVAGACGVAERQLDPEQVQAVESGREALVSYGCVGCHQVPNLSAGRGLATTQGRVGPSLAGIASRQVIAGQLPNTPDNLARWIRDPQDIDPGNVMPDLGVTDTDAAAMAAFLGTLE